MKPQKRLSTQLKESSIHWAIRLLIASVAAPSFSALFVESAFAAEEMVTLNFVNADLEAVIKAIGHYSNKNFLIDPRVKGTLNLVSEKPVTKQQAYQTLLSALRLQGFTIVESGGLLKVLPENDAKLQSSPLQAGRTGKLAGDQIITQVFRLNYESANNLVPVLRPLIAPNNTINAYPGNNTLVITDYADNLNRIAKIIAAVDTPAGSDLEVIPVKNGVALDMAAMLNRLLDESRTAAAGAAPDGSQKVNILADSRTNSLLIRAANPARLALARGLVAKLDTPSASGSNMHVVYLKNAEAVKLAQTLRAIVAADSSGSNNTTSNSSTSFSASSNQQTGALGGSQAGNFGSSSNSNNGLVAGAGGMIQADAATNTLIITAPEPIYRNMRDIIDRLDARRAQVFIEALIVEVTADKLAEFGIQWQNLTGLTNSSTSVIGGTNFGSSSAGTNLIGATKDITSLSNGLNIGVVKGSLTIAGTTFTNLGLLARALESDAKANILSTPNLLTLDNEEAKIVVGQNVPFVTGQYTTTGTSTSATSPFQTIERKDVGLTLKVKPQISEGGAVKLQIYQESSSVQSTTNSAGIITNKRSIESNVIVDDGQTIVLGGLMQDQTSDSRDGVPGLQSIPVFGALFRSDIRKRSKTNLMVFLRPYVMRTAEASDSLLGDRYEFIRNQALANRSDSWLLGNQPLAAPPPLATNLKSVSLPSTPKTPVPITQEAVVKEAGVIEPTTPKPVAPEPAVATPVTPAASVTPTPSVETAPVENVVVPLPVTNSAGRTATPVILQVAAFTDIEKANLLEAKLKEKGLNAYVQTYSGISSQLHRVRVSSERTELNSVKDVLNRMGLSTQQIR